ncbi:efflux RND transporter periplasmic adaptor subunit [Wenzhouxiangella sp. XN79A]|uniref:efflux RND transporter periplasmic adaptor subunit n=1 Tax=Wenzhouxiangella sp. XN79A TaxID=2724193 RepID=UPI00144A6069|nr:efflux RND transporter periplasmic adaptor subunit [Wenzhouxiangella sp. XN79A]NKI35722.1 efflux RND transporter periplasmic adaptor subunit [Wenzhouxiangella sp. XN79A]
MNNVLPISGLVRMALLTLSVALLAGCGGDDDAPAPGARSEARASLPVRAFKVSRRDLSRHVQVASPVEPLRTIQLAARTEGIIASVAVETGDRVEAGQLLARIDVSEQRAELARAQAALREAEANFERLRRLRDREYIDEASFVTAQSELDVARSDVDLWQTRVDFGRITAPVSGYVIGRMVEPGAAITRLGTAFVLADLDALVARIGVSELDVAEIRPGDAVPVSFDALKTAPPIEGRVRRVFPAADGASRLVTVEIELPDAYAKGVRPGFLARADLLVDYKQDVLAVPAGSVGMGDPSYVMVIDENDELVRRAVSTGIIRGDWREIVGGLEPGDRIVSSNPLELAEGDRVRIVDTLSASG